MLLTISKHPASRVVYLERNELNNVHLKLLVPPSPAIYFFLSSATHLPCEPDFLTGGGRNASGSILPNLQTVRSPEYLLSALLTDTESSGTTDFLRSSTDDPL